MNRWIGGVALLLTLASGVAWARRVNTEVAVFQTFGGKIIFTVMDRDNERTAALLAVDRNDIQKVALIVERHELLALRGMIDETIAELDRQEAAPATQPAPAP